MPETDTTKAPAKKATSRPPAKDDTPNHRNLAEALAAFQGEVPSVHKGKTAKMEKEGRTLYTYDYADLADVTQAAFPVLSRHGLSFTTRPVHLDGLGYVLQGVLRHASGEQDEGFLPIHGRDAQAIGSSLTYNRRYLLGCMTGIVTDEDDDGARASAARQERPQSDQPRQAQGRREAEPMNGPPNQGPPPHIAMLWDLLGGLSDQEKEELGSWWDQWVSQGGLPPKENSAACTPAQVAMVEQKVQEVREWAAWKRANPDAPEAKEDGRPGPSVGGPAGPPPQEEPARPPEPAPGPQGKPSLADRLKALEARGPAPLPPTTAPAPDAPPATEAEAIATVQEKLGGSVVETIPQNS